MNGLNSSITLNNWREVEDWVDSFYTVLPSYLNKVNSRKYPVDAFSLGQMASKAWLYNFVSTLQLPKQDVVALLGCWVGSLVPSLITSLRPNRVYGFDIDPASVELSEQFNQRYVEDSWRYKGVVADVCGMHTSDMQFETGGELITVKPNCIVNTSCEHMGTEWFETADSDQLIIMQTNNNPEFDGHINCVHSIEHMAERYPLSNTLYKGSLTIPAYTRYMQIGYK